MSRWGSIDYERLLERLPTPVMVLNRDLRIVAVSDQFVASTMTTREQLLGSELFTAFPANPADPGAGGVAAMRESMERVLSTRRSHAMGIVKYDIPTPDGFSERYWSPVNSPILDPDGEVELIVHRSDDVTELVRDGSHRRVPGGAPEDVELRLIEHARQLQEANRDLEQANRRFERVAAQQATVARLGQQAAAATDPDDLMAAAAVAVNELDEVCGCQVVEQRAQGTELLLLTAAGECATPASAGALDRDAAALTRRALNAREPVTIIEGPPEGGESSVVALGLTGVGSAMAAIVGDHQDPFGVIAVHSRSRHAFGADDASFLSSVANVLAGGIERARREEEMRLLALHDDLTGLPNRKLLLDRLGYALSRARREGGNGALALLDLDGFKAINDTLGHHAGDEVLRQVSANLTAALRGSDTVARLGGDEFALLLPEVGTQEEAGKVAHKVLEAVRRRLRLDDREVGMDASVGLALFPVHGDDEGLLLRRADAAMYVAKRGGGGYAVYTAEHDELHQRRSGEVADLRRGIDEGELTVHYQPKVSLSDESVCGLEALVRWSHPDRGVLAPDQFVPLAEESGLIRSLTMRVLTSALEQARRWRDEGIDAPISVNLSADCLHDPELLSILMRCLNRAGVPPTGLELEVAESAFMKRPGAAMTVIRDLAAAGIRTSMDDFGTGQSSLAYLERLPLHELKIDKSFLLEPSAASGEATMVDAVIGLAHTFDLAVVGEGIENREVCRALRRRGCDRGQGFHLQAPLPADEMTTWLRGRRFGRAPLAS